MPMVYKKVMTKEELKKWRGRNSMTQASLADTLGVDVMTVSRWETGLRSIPVYLKLALNWIEQEGRQSKGHKTKKGG
jgi:DNA-binding transcriptional regulator YiaG